MARGLFGARGQYGRLYEYPFWGPDNDDEAAPFARPTPFICQPQLSDIEEDSLRLRVPSVDKETTNLDYETRWQWNPIIMGAPQAPVTVPDQFARADSLLAYAQMTLGAAHEHASNVSLGNAGAQHKALTG